MNDEVCRHNNFVRGLIVKGCKFFNLMGGKFTTKDDMVALGLELELMELKELVEYQDQCIIELERRSSIGDPL